MSFMSFASEMLGNLFKPPATSQYPFKPRKVYEADRGKVINNIDNCIFCGMCMRNCPSDAITVDRNARTWKINRFAWRLPPKKRRKCCRVRRLRPNPRWF